jgi:two-component system, OmpR family, phosphate regulon sensor histidine kinase PhoR
VDTKVIKKIIILTSVSMVAAIAAQLFWVIDAWSLKEDQFTNTLKLSLKSIVNELMETELNKNINTFHTEKSAPGENVQIYPLVNPVTLDSLVKNKLDEILSTRLYFYGVYRDGDTTLITGNAVGKMKYLLLSAHKISLSGIYQQGNYILSVYVPRQRSLLINKIIILPLMSGLFLMVLLFSFFFTIYFIIRHKKLSDMKTDFVNNMTHELKTPIATIGVSAEMLVNEKILNTPEKIKKYSRIIIEENTRLKKLVDGVLQIALYEREDFTLKLKELDLHKIIKNCINSFKVQVTERKGCIKTNLSARHTKITADNDHLTNILYNLLDNANKYSPVNPHITVNTFNQNSSIHIEIEDRGIGISKENQQVVFKKFHRLQRGDIHNVKGHGLGLFYVKTMVEKMGGRIEVKSELNKGSLFTLTFPV